MSTKSSSKKQGVHYCMKVNSEWFEPSHQHYKGWVPRIPNDEYSVFDVPCNAPLTCDYMGEHIKTKKHIDNHEQWKKLKRQTQHLTSQQC